MAPAEGPGPVIRISRVGSWKIPLRLLEKATLAVFREEGVSEAELSLTFLDDDGIRTLNREYLGRDHPTDVIAFPLHESDQPVIGDVYVGYEQAARQAEAEGVGLEEELARLAIHGTLHVLGYDHPLGEDRWESSMFRIQEDILERVLGS